MKSDMIEFLKNILHNYKALQHHRSSSLTNYLYFDGYKV